MAPTILSVDGVAYNGRFGGFSCPLDVMAPDGLTLRLLPWTYAAHIATLRDCTSAAMGSLELDGVRYARRVLQNSGLDRASLAWLYPLALWWGAGGDAQDIAFHGNGAVDIGGVQAWLRPWTEGERLTALGAAFVRDDRTGDWLDAAGYLDAMVRRSLVALDPAGILDELDSQQSARLLNAVIALNLPDPAADPLLSGALPQAAVDATLGLCRNLGWTPAQVLATPAAEVQRLRALVQRVAPMPHPGGLAAEPGAVVFTFTEDPA